MKWQLFDLCLLLNTHAEHDVTLSTYSDCETFFWITVNSIRGQRRFVVLKLVM